MSVQSFVQIGHGRDGLRPFNSAIRKRGARAVLVEGVEGKASFEKGRRLGEAEFDEVIFAESSDTHSILDAVRKVAACGQVRLVYPGFELFTLAANDIGAAIGLDSHNARDVIERFRFKSQQRNWLKALGRGELQPMFDVCSQLVEAREIADQIGYPVVLKPEDSGGSMGVVRVDDAAELAAKWCICTGLTLDNGMQSSGRVLVEEFVDGPEIGLQGVVDRNGSVTLLGMSSKTIYGGQSNDRFFEKEHILRPGSQIPECVRDLARDVIQSLGLVASPFHMDVRISSRGPLLIETGARLSGAGVTRALQKATGRDWADAALAAWCGEPVELGACLGKFCGVRFFAGSVRDIVFPSMAFTDGESGQLRLLSNASGHDDYRHISDRSILMEACANSPERVTYILETLQRSMQQ